MTARTLPKETLRTALARSQVYGLLARAFARPDPALEAAVAGGDFREALAEAFDALACRDLLTADSLTAADGLGTQFVRLFNPSVDANCPPYSTEYTGAHVFMRAQQLADVAGFYRAFGLRVAAGFRERPDHIAAELEFMQVLALKEARALARRERAHAAVCRRARARFLREHLGRWLDPYLQRLSALSRDSFYTRLAALTRDFVAWDARRLGVEPEVALPLRTAGPEPTIACPEPTEGACPASGGKANVPG